MLYEDWADAIGRQLEVHFQNCLKDLTNFLIVNDNTLDRVIASADFIMKWKALDDGTESHSEILKVLMEKHTVLQLVDSVTRNRC